MAESRKKQHESKQPQSWNRWRKQLKARGFTIRGGSGSHFDISKPGVQPFTVTVHSNKLIWFYVKRIEEALEEDTANAQGNQ